MDPWLRLLSVLNMLNVESHRLIFLRFCFFFLFFFSLLLYLIMQSGFECGNGIQNISGYQVEHETFNPEKRGSTAYDFVISM